MSMMCLIANAGYIATRTSHLHSGTALMMHLQASRPQQGRLLSDTCIRDTFHATRPPRTLNLTHESGSHLQAVFGHAPGAWQALPAARGRAHERQGRHALGRQHRQPRGDHAAQRVAHHVYGAPAQVLLCPRTQPGVIQCSGAGTPSMLLLTAVHQ